MTEKNKARAQDPARSLASYIKRGGSIAYPLEPCYGLGCDPRNPWALKQLIRLKGRNADHYKHLQPYAGAGAGTGLRQRPSKRKEICQNHGSMSQNIRLNGTGPCGFHRPAPPPFQLD